jgi:hypothetical protein
MCLLQIFIGSFIARKLSKWIDDEEAEKEEKVRCVLKVVILIVWYAYITCLFFAQQPDESVLVESASVPEEAKSHEEDSDGSTRYVRVVSIDAGDLVVVDSVCSVKDEAGLLEKSVELTSFRQQKEMVGDEEVSLSGVNIVV